MSNNNNNSYSLVEEFLLGQQIVRDFDTDSSVEKVEQAKQHLNRAAIYVNNLDLFSSNETVEDMHTNDLKYILLPFYLALIEQQEIDLSKRLKSIQIAKKCFENFIEICEILELLNESTKEEIRIMNEEEIITPQLKRQLLVQKHKEKKENEAKQKVLNERKLKIIKQKGEEAEDLVSTDMLEIERELYLIEINNALSTSISEIKLIDQEIPLLKHRQKRLDEGGEEALILDSKLYRQKVEDWKKSSGKPPITLYKDSKGEIRQKVFQPSWIQPTVSIEQAGEIDYQIMLAQQQKNNNNNNNVVKTFSYYNIDPEEIEEYKDESDPDDEIALQQARDWDEFKDDNPSGSGNTTGNLG